MPATVKTPTLKSKKEKLYILDDRVQLFRNTSAVWQMQMWIREEGKYVRESLRTDDLVEAKHKAEERFIFYRAKIINDEKIFSITAEELREKFLKHIDEQVKLKQLSPGRASNIKTYTKHYLDFVGRTTKIQNIDRKKFREYLSFRRGKKVDILATVVVNESITIKQMYRFAVAEGLIDQLYVPDFGTIKVKQDEAVRESYTTKEYTDLTNVSRSWHKAKDVTNEEQRYYRRLINDFIVVMANSGFRTQEARLLKWKDVRRITKMSNDEVYAEVVIRAENSKVRKSRTVEIRRGDVFERIKTYSKHTEPDDFVFSRLEEEKNEVLDKTRLYDVFAELVTKVKEKSPDFDDTKTLYCLRHLFITIRIMAGINVYDIAKICGTSLVQIQKHYDAASSLLTSQTMNKNQIRFDSHGNVVLEEGGKASSGILE
jgi:integrase